MLLVETFVGPSKIEGVGTFAVASIKKGTKIWTFSEAFDRLIEISAMNAFPAEVRNFLERYTYRSPRYPDYLILEMDNGRFMNHASRPNTEILDWLDGYASRDIAAGEELTCDYNELEPGFVLLPSVRPRRERARPQIRVAAAG